MKNLKKQNGITLIALVITIIVLLILAGITINLTLGENGIITRAQEAGRNYTEAANYENKQLQDFTDLTDKIIANVTGGNAGTSTGENVEPTIPALGTIIKKENNINYTADGAGNTIPVPVGFTAITTQDQGTKETGFVIKDTTTNADGTPTATNGNEFVWVPVDSTTSYSYERVGFTRDDWTYKQIKGDYDSTSQSYKIIRVDQSEYNFTETMPTISENRTELQSVNEYKGFYIGRYETGITGYSNKNTSTTNTLTEYTGYTGGTAVIQKDKEVWNYITRDKAKEIAEGMYSASESVTSRLCSSYAWDTALKFIETKNSEYPTNSTVGNYSDKAETLGKPAKTGKTEAVNNIYDMGGNVSEWTTEVCSNASSPCTDRGGRYAKSASDVPAANRGNYSTTYVYDNFGFRATLFL